MRNLRPRKMKKIVQDGPIDISDEENTQDVPSATQHTYASSSPNTSPAHNDGDNLNEAPILPQIEFGQQEELPTSVRLALSTRVDERSSPRVLKSTNPSPKRAKKIISVGQPSNVVESSLKTRMSLGRLVSLIEQLNEKQKDAVKEIGFGSFLNLKLHRMNSQLAYFLVDNLDPFERVLNLGRKKTLKIEKEDVFCVLGLPNTGHLVVDDRFSTKEEESEFSSFLNDWRVTWGLDRGAPMLTKMPEAILSFIDGGVSFKRNFALFLIASCIHGSQAQQVPYGVLRSLYHVDRIRDFDWCSYVLEKLMESVATWRKNREGFFCGSTLFLVIFYVERIVHLRRKVDRKFPIMEGWTYETLSRRVLEELKDGGFGKGCIEPRIALKEEKIAKSKFEATIEAFADKSIQLAEFLNSYGEMAAMVRAEFPDSSILKTLYQHGVSALNAQANASTEDQTDAPPSTSVPQPPLTPDDEFFSNPSVLKAIDDLISFVTKGNKNKQRDPSMPSFKLLSSDEEEDNDHQNTTLSDGMLQEIDAMVEDVDRHRDVEVDHHHDVEQVDHNPAVEEVHRVREVDHMEVEHHDENMPNVEPARSRRTRLRLPTILRSPFWQKGKHMPHMAKLGKNEKEITDYLFNVPNNAEKSDFVFQWEDLFLTREEMYSLGLEQEVNRKVIDMWSRLLNLKNKERAINSPNRLFFTTNAFESLTEEEWSRNPKANKAYKEFKNMVDSELDFLANDAIRDFDLVFFPIHVVGHNVRRYYLVCFDLRVPMLYVIDNMDTPDVYNKDYRVVTDLLAKALSMFLKSKKHNKSKDVEILKPNRLLMPWRSSGDLKDTGIYTMKHMETFNGNQNWDSGFEKQKLYDQVFKYRHVMCYQIITTPENTLQEDVKKKAKLRAST